MHGGVLLQRPFRVSPYARSCESLGTTQVPGHLAKVHRNSNTNSLSYSQPPSAISMDKFAPSSGDRSRSGTPAVSRFASQAATAEDLLKEQTVGLVNLNDFRKRRAEALERKERDGANVDSGATTPRDG
jgi:hypothetical protein